MKRTNLTQWLKWIMGLDYSPAPVPVRVPMRTGLRLDQLDERRLPHATPLACPFDTAQQAPTETDTTTDSATADSATATDSSLAPRAFDFPSLELRMSENGGVQSCSALA